MVSVDLNAQQADGAAADQAISRALLAQVAAGVRGGVARIWRPVPALSWSRRVQLGPGAGAAEALAREAGFAPVRRFTGGQAVVLGRGSLCVGFAEPSTSFAGTEQRYRRLSAAIVKALAESGVDAQRGALAGEWCAGAWSIHASGVKLAGLAQRAVAGAAWAEAVVELAPDPAARQLVISIYRALGVPLDPATLGSVTELAGAKVHFAQFAACLASGLEPAQLSSHLPLTDAP